MTPERSPLERLAEVAVYAPLGLVLEAPRLVPRLVQRGRSQVELTRVLVRFAAREGSQVAGRVLGPLLGCATGAPAADGGAPPQAPGAAAPSAPRTRLAPVPTGPGASIRPDELAIPDYDTLAASQVVSRLDGLGEEELEDVRLYESAHRSRRTILNRIAQLQSG